MRDPDRLDEFYDRLKELHKKYVPDWRFGQMVFNIMRSCGDPFFWEEKEYLDKAEDFLKNIYSRKE